MPAPVVITNASVILTTSTTSYDISDHVTRVRLTREYDMHDVTRMGHTAHARVQGLESWQAECELLQNFSSTGNPGNTSGIDKILSGLTANAVASIAIRPVNAARTSDNPEYSGSVSLQSYAPLDVAVGEVAKTRAPFLSAGNLVRTVSSS